MAKKWRIIRVFISSTFMDMQSERDLLVRFVFPKLRQKLAEYRIHIIEVDLRWGVSTEQDALTVCRRTIDECHPRFLCMLGERYGWVPPGRKHSITEDEIRYSVLSRPEINKFAFFYFRNPLSTTGMIEQQPGEFKEVPGSMNEKSLEKLKCLIADAGYTPYVYSGKWDDTSRCLTGLHGFGEQVYEDLLNSIEEECKQPAGQLTDEFEIESWAHESLIEKHCQHFVLGNRKPIIEKLCKSIHLSRKSEGYICLYGEAGIGKSALLAFLVNKLKNTNSTSAVLLPHFAGASDDSTDIYKVLRRFCHELLNVSEIGIKLPDNKLLLHVAFWEILEEFCKTNDVIFVLDSVEEMSQINQSNLFWWLPNKLPTGAIFILSTTPNHVSEIKKRLDPSYCIKIEQLLAADKEALINSFLERFGKTMTDVQRSVLFAKGDSGKPLYLLTALEELRTLGTYEAISSRIEEIPPDVKGIFGWILDRLEDEKLFRDRRLNTIGKQLVEIFSSLIAVSRNGLSYDELAQIIASIEEEENSNKAYDAMGNVALLTYLLRPYLIQQGELITFYHNQFIQVVEKRYLDSPIKRKEAHAILADFYEKQNVHIYGTKEFNYRKLTQQPWHTTHAFSWRNLERILFSKEFLQAKVSAGLVTSLVQDYYEAAKIARIAPEPPSESSILYQVDRLAWIPMPSFPYNVFLR